MRRTWGGEQACRACRHARERAFDEELQTLADAVTDATRDRNPGMMRRCVAAAAIALFAQLGCDPVHSNSIAALGDEAPGVRKGPLHRPGQPCLTCHDGELGDPPAFSVAGTIFQRAEDKTAAVGAQVFLYDAGGKLGFTAVTNAAGNFYVQPHEYTPTFPMRVEVLYQGVTVKMTSRVGRDGSCADCHTDPAGPASAGHVFIPADGVTP
jgi:hypothetical protein